MSTEPQQFIYTEELYRFPKKTIVLIPVSWETLPEEHKTLLSKILGSVRLSTAAVQIICREKAEISELKVFNPAVIIAFGVGLSPTSELYTSAQADGIRIIQSEALGSLNDATKKSLWNVLKTTFA